MVERIYDLFILILKIYGVYFAFIASFAIFGRKKEEETEERLSFAALIAARNEEDCIACSVESLKNQDYPSELIDIYVIANNCDDNTSLVAKEAGAKVIEAPSSVQYKGGALAYGVEELKRRAKDYDAFMVFDADNELNENFVSSMNKTLANGYRVAKSRILAKNREESWVAMCYDIHFSTANIFLNRARVRLGLSARLIGTGFAIKTDCLEEIGGFKTETITEDAELFAILASKGEKIGFSEDAIAYDEEPLKFRTSLIQRRRWMSGIMEVVRLKAGDLFKGILNPKSFKYSLDTLMQLSFSYVHALMPFLLILGLINEPGEFLNYLPLASLKSYVGLTFSAFLVIGLEKRLSLEKNVILGILLYPFFVFSFIPLLTLSLFFKTKEWEEIDHEGFRLKESKLELD